LIILDNSVISAFCEIGRLELLREILHKLNLQAIIPTTVLKEIIFDDALLAVTTGESSGDNWIKVMPVNNYAAYLKLLHPGEAGVIALAKQMNCIAALDDLDARKVSEKENIRLTGTLGIVKVGYELCPVKDMHELKNIIQELRRVWFRMSNDLENEILDTEKVTHLHHS
jgi:predicted nucleic acid-binding protein